jgi:hypothetical protein
LRSGKVIYTTHPRPKAAKTLEYPTISAITWL